MSSRVGIDDHSRIEQILRVSERLERLHHRVGFNAPLGFDERSHVASGAVFSLQRTIVFAHHQVHHIVDEVPVLSLFLLSVEALRNYEMQIAVLGVAKDDGIRIAVLFE